MNRLFTSGDQIIGDSASASVLPLSSQCWFSLGLAGLTSLLSKRTLNSLPQHHNLKAVFFCAQPFFMVQFSHLYESVDGLGREVSGPQAPGGNDTTPGSLFFLFQSCVVMMKPGFPELNFISNLELTNAVFLTERSCLNYVNELYVFLGICLSSRFRSIVFWPRMTQFVPMLSQNACCEWPGATLPVLKLFFFLSLSN